MDLQRINVKLLATAPPDFSVDSFLAIFGRWRNDAENPAGWFDLADYAHMPKGTGVVLVGKQGNFSIDLGDPGPGLLYCGKQDYSGPVEQRITETFERCLALVKPLLTEPEYPADLKIQPGSWELAINDRLDSPNTAATDQDLRPGISAALDTVFGPGAYSIEREPDPQKRYGFSIRASQITKIDDLFRS